MTSNALLNRLVLILLLAGAAYAQTTNVTGTIQDANNNLYANGTASAASVVPTGQRSTTTGPVSTNAQGQFSLNVASNISYVFTVCSAPVQIGPLANSTPKQVCFSGPPILITGGSFDISSIMNPLAPLIGPGAPSGNGGGGNNTAAGQPNDIQINSAGALGADSGIFTEDPVAHLLSVGVGGVVSGGPVSAGATPPPNCLTGINGSFCAGQTTNHPVPTTGVNSLDSDATNGIWLQTLGTNTAVPVPNAVTSPLSMSATGNISLSNSGVTPGSYTNPSITVASTGLVTAASNGHPSSGTPNVGVSFTSQTSVTIPASTSGASSANVLVECYDTSAPAKRIVPGSVTVDTGTFQVVVSFNTATSGFCVVNNSGPAIYTAALASASSFSILATTHKLGTHIASIMLTDPQNRQVTPGNVVIDASGNVTITNNYAQSFTLTMTN